jgi:hypothetical protein
MQLIDVCNIGRGKTERRIELLLGDLTDIPVRHKVDVLVVSAFPGDYTPTPRSLIGGLYSKGLDIGDLARAPETDLRQNFSCWLSTPIGRSLSDMNFGRILCFEPLVRGSPPELVGDIFRSLAPFVYAEPEVRSIALPIVAAGDQRNSLAVMTEALLDASLHWLRAGMPIDVVKVVVRGNAAAETAARIFQEKTRAFQEPGKSVHQDPLDGEGNKTPEYDVFISYARSDEEAAAHLYRTLTSHGARVFIDRFEINTGASWQQRIFDALDNSKTAVSLYSPEFVHSKVCKEEFNIAWARQRDLEREFIFPLLIRDAELPTYMKILNFVDCRVSDPTKLLEAANVILKKLNTASA